MDTTNLSECGFCPKPYIFDIDSNIAAPILITATLMGMILNVIVFVSLLLSRGSFSNPDLYVLALCVTNFGMVGPCYCFDFYTSWIIDPCFSRFEYDIFLFGMQACGGSSVWLTTCISADRFLTAYYNIQYPMKETKTKVFCKIGAVIGCHVGFCLLYNFIPYAPGVAETPFEPFVANKNITWGPPPLIPPVKLVYKIYNCIRLLIDRVLPWFLCPSLYAAVFILRNKQKTAIQAPGMDTRMKQRMDARMRRSHRLVFGITASMVCLLLPETIFDASDFFFNYDTRSSSSLLYWAWYMPCICDPVICIASTTKIRDSIKRLLHMKRSINIVVQQAASNSHIPKSTALH